MEKIIIILLVLGYTISIAFICDLQKQINAIELKLWDDVNGFDSKSD